MFPSPTEEYSAVVLSTKRRDELWDQLERDFDRRALVPRFLVLVILVAATLLEYGHGHRLAHWIVLAGYGGTTLALALAARLGVDPVKGQLRACIPVVATFMDATLTVYVIADHLPRDVNEVSHSIDTVSLLPALLLLLQTGLRMRRDLVIIFGGVVLAGWIISLLLILGPEVILRDQKHGLGTSVAARQVFGLLSFAAASGFVLYAVHWMRIAASEGLQARLDRMLLARFLPQGVAAEVVRSGEGSSEPGASERHACLLTLDLRGFSSLTRERPSGEVITILMEFRRLAHDAVSANGGIVDKYIGDGVLALFLDGSPEAQAVRALATVRAITRTAAAWNECRCATLQDGEVCPHPIRVIAAVHQGVVLAGVFDDGRRAEFTVLGPAMNALSRIERRAKSVGADVVATDSLLALLPQRSLEGVAVSSLPRCAEDLDEDLPAISALTFATDYGGSSRSDAILNAEHAERDQPLQGLVAVPMEDGTTRPG